MLVLVHQWKCGVAMLRAARKGFGVEPVCVSADGNSPELHALFWPLACPSREGISMLS